MIKLLLALWLACLAVALPAPQAEAGEFVVGIGRDDIRRGRSPATSAFLELRAAPEWRWRDAGFGFGVAIEGDTDRDVWAGGGLVATIPLGAGLRLVPTLMVGVYRQGEGNDLGRTFPVFRANLELDITLAPGWRAGLVLGHKSNGNLGPINPGIESLYLTIGRTF